MLPLVFAAIVYLFMLVGAVVFLICVAVPSIRRFALSAALWCAAWGPCCVAFLSLAGLALVAHAFTTTTGDSQAFHSPRLVSAFGWGYLILGAFSTAAVASGAAWLHQFIVRRFTFALFRVYVTLIVAGIGSVFGWSLDWFMLSRDIPHVWAWSLPSMLVLVAGFGSAAYRGARGLRGGAPANFAWVSQEEHAGS